MQKQEKIYQSLSVASCLQGLYLVVICCAALGQGCAASRNQVMPWYSETPILYSENRVFYVAPSDSVPTEGKDFHRRKLYQPFELAIMQQDIAARARSGSLTLPATFGGAPSDVDGELTQDVIDPLVVRHNDPLTVSIKGVRIPDDMGRQYMQRTFDVAVILDISTGMANNEAVSLIAWYQRDVPPGQLLNFSDLLVYADPNWDSQVPPYFRLRVVDVRELREDTGLTQLLSGVGNLTSMVGGLMPSPAIPVVGLAMEAAKQLGQRPRQRVLLDFAVQFYSEEQRRQSVGELGQLRKGSWLVMGRPVPEIAVQQGVERLPVVGSEQQPSNDAMQAMVPSDFWRRSLYLDHPTGQVHDAAGHLMQVPYIEVTVSTSQTQVPSIVAKRSAELMKLLAAPDGRTQTGELELTSGQLMSAVGVYIAERRLTRNRSLADIDYVVDMLRRDEHARKGGAGAMPMDRLSNESQRQLVLLLQRVAPGEAIISGAEAVEWWDKTRGQATLRNDPNAPLGFIVTKGKK